MPRIPVYGEQQVNTRPAGTPFASTDVRGASVGALAEGAARIAQVAEKAQMRAISADITKALGDYQAELTDLEMGSSEEGELGLDLTKPEGGPDDRPRGILQVRGKDAAEQSTKALDWSEKRRQAIAQSLKDERAREAFLTKSRDLYDGSRRRIETHVNGQLRAAEVEALATAVAAAIETAGTHYADGETAREQVDALRAPIRALTGSEEATRAKLAEVEAAVLAKRLDGYLGKSDWRGAKELYEAAGENLGKFRQAYGERIEKHQRAGIAEDTAEHLAKDPELTKADGTLDVDKALERIDETVSAEDPELRKEIRALYLDRARLAEGKWKEDTDDISKRAYATYNAGGWRSVPPEMKDELNRRNPALYNQLRDEAEMRWRRNRSDNASNRRALAEANTLAMQAYMQLPVEERAKLNVDTFLAGFGASEVGVGAVKVRQQKDKENIEKGLATPEETFVKEAKASAQGFLANPDELRLFEAEARMAFTEHFARVEKPPSRDEARKIIADLLLSSRAQTRSLGGAIGRASRSADLRGPAPEPQAPQGPKPTGRRKKGKDGVMWEEMSDGTARRVQ